ncbi:MAG: GWxTD domain-containing protein [candidate division KSB1 bacterium]|nr:GWxTD domain-containing protein [candidate division KSB1 bacterium]
MRGPVAFLCLWLTSHLIPAPLLAQSFEEIAEDFFGGPLLEYDAFTFFDESKEKARVDVHFVFVYDILQFVRIDGDSYRARYEVSALLKRKPVEGLADLVSYAQGTVTVTTYPETNSRTQKVTGKLSFWTEPGTYTLELRLTDLESGKTLTRTKKVAVWDFCSPGVHLSDVVFADSAGCRTQRVDDLRPLLDARFSKPESGFVAIVQVVPVPESDSVSVAWAVASRDGRVLRDETFRAAGRRLLCLPLHNVVSRPGRYELRIQARVRSYKAEMRKTFSIAWGEAFVDTSSLDVILGAMSYIARPEDVDKMKSSSRSLQALLLEDFWKQRDPTPSTPENELREEFFRRLDFANRFFSVPELGVDGWQTDRGRIYIVYGHPTHVEKEPAQMQEASYEVWYYSHLRKRFVFVDAAGDGLYRLKQAD